MAIRKVLVANRGEIASRIFRTARALDIATVAVFSDVDSGAPYVQEADEAVRLPGAAPADTYLDHSRLLAAAASTGADAVHPGYGFLSENAEFARACLAAGLVFVGPSADVIERMGAKPVAKELMRQAGVPVLDGVVVEPGDDAPGLAERLGYPLLVKATFGGGGRGMRVVESADEVVAAIESAQRGAQAAFGDGAVFLERLVRDPRHIEVQILGDQQGRVISLYERECSIQRRYQKIVEEAPSPAVDDALRANLGRAAVAAGEAIGYVGAGTVEFVLEPDGRFHFLEVNTRLQVEHPVTELITGLDLVELQFRIAEGEPLPRAAVDATISGHAIEARLYAEDVSAGFLPATGTLHRFAVASATGVRVDAGVATGSVVTADYDPLLAKVIAYGATRDEARRRLARALQDARIHGVATNRGLLVEILREPYFIAGRIDTGYLGRHDPTGDRSPDERLLSLHVLAAALADQAARRASARVLAGVPSGWRNVATQWQWTEYEPGGRVDYRLLNPAILARVDGVELGEIVGYELTATGVDLEADGVRRRFEVHRVGRQTFVDSSLGSTEHVERPRFAPPADAVPTGSLLAPMPGSLVRIAVAEGDSVSVGDVIVVLEAMKMEHAVRAPYSGTVAKVLVTGGQQVTAGAVLAVVEP